ncbi:hypothetical protein NC652_027867 [Populus alba x Populus x berolinensis]|nr:hypothetical protein NC652_027867 [Populus alba x Populus x berolinensis]
MYLLHQIGLLPFTAATRNYCTTIMKKVVSKRELVIIMQFGCQQLRFLMVTFTSVQKITLTYLQFGKIVKVLLRRNEVVLRCWESITLENLSIDSDMVLLSCT